MLRHRLTDEQWALIADLFPQPQPGPGRKPAAPRRMMDGILWILNTGAPWRDLPPELGPKSTVWGHFDQWNRDGTLVAALQRLRGEVKIGEALWCVDGTSVHAARCAAGGGKKTNRKNRRTTHSAAAVAEGTPPRVQQVREDHQELRRHDPTRLHPTLSVNDLT